MWDRAEKKDRGVNDVSVQTEQEEQRLIYRLKWFTSHIMYFRYILGYSKII